MEIEPKEVMRFFREISNIPRKSGEEKRIAEYLVNFAKKRNLEYQIDEVYNVVIKKEATKGNEKRQSIALQAHTDMICEKIEGSNHDFSKDPIMWEIEGDFIQAKGTTLGADNGVGVAFLLAILDSSTIQSPKIEAIFTVQEETTMIGAIQLDLSQIESKRIISLDNGKEGKILVSSANCIEWKGIKKGTKEKSEEKKCYQLRYRNFKGGHSGGNIGDEKRGNPILLAASILNTIENVQLIEIQGGSRVNVIPRDCMVQFATEEKDIMAKLVLLVKQQKQLFEEEVEIECNQIREEEMLYDRETTKQILGFLNDFQNGAIVRDEMGNVLQSGNLGAIRSRNGKIEMEFSERSNVLGLEQEYLNRLEEKIKQYQIEIVWKQELKGVEKKENNSLVRDCKNIYEEMYRKPMEEIVSQGVVEGGFFTAKKSECEYICIGANTFDVHSPKERVSISSLQRTWGYLKQILEKI